MVQFNELRINLQGTRLIIDASIKDLQYYNNVYIDSIIIDTQDTFSINGPSSNPIFTYTVESEPSKIYALPECDSCNPVRDLSDDEICFTQEEEGEKRVRLELDSNVLKCSLDDTLFFVYVVTKGIPAADTPCNMDNQTTMGVVANMAPFYKVSTNYIKELNNTCEVPKGFADVILKYNAFRLSIQTGHYPIAIQYWNKFFKNIKTTPTISKCNCYG